MGTLRILELPEQERPREKLAALGAGALADSELIAILLRTGMQGASAIDIARDLLREHGSLSGLARVGVAELAKRKGLGPAKAVQLAAAFGLASRLARESLAGQPMDSPPLIYELLGTEMRAFSQERIRVVLLNTKLHLLRVEDVSIGSLNEAMAHPREILRPALLHAAYSFILVHNHPSGDPMPSDADRRFTTRLRGAAELLQITMHDHIIIGAPAPGRLPYFSFREAGMLHI